jgi:Acyl-CoA carboxylase epsilon subunit
MNSTAIRIVHGRADEDEYVAAVVVLLAALRRARSCTRSCTGAPPQAHARAGWDRHPQVTYRSPQSWQFLSTERPVVRAHAQGAHR